MNLVLQREEEKKDHTPGTLTAGNMSWYTLERPSTGDFPCIPSGTYPITQFVSPHNGPDLLLHDVPNRSMIEIHGANFASQLKGCIAPGMERGENYVSRSKEALHQIIGLLVPVFARGEEVTIEVRDV